MNIPLRKSAISRWHGTLVITLVLLTGACEAVLCATQRAAASVEEPSTSYFESNASAAALYGQGAAAGKAATQGIVILDFGRPAAEGASEGTMDFSATFVSFGAITTAVEQYLEGYLRYAPAYTTLDVAVGTNNSCGTGQPCGHAICGCSDEPLNFGQWGSELAATVEELDAWTRALKIRSDFTDDVQVVAGDDAEPAYDPGFTNTYNLLAGYARAVDGPYPPMVDFGSADANYWTEGQLLQVAYGFAPDVPMPEVYQSPQVAEWAALLRYAKARGKVVTIFGILTDAESSAPQSAYNDLVNTVVKVTGQSSIGWISVMAPLEAVS